MVVDESVPPAVWSQRPVAVAIGHGLKALGVGEVRPLVVLVDLVVVPDLTVVGEILDLEQLACGEEVVTGVRCRAVVLFPNPRDLDFVDIDDSLAGRMAVALSAAGFETNSPAYDESLRKALFSWMGNENLEMRWSDDPVVDRTVLGLLLEED